MTLLSLCVGPACFRRCVGPACLLPPGRRGVAGGCGEARARLRQFAGDALAIGASLSSGPMEGAADSSVEGDIMGTKDDPG